MKFIVV